MQHIIAASILALVPSALAVGSARVVNNCDSPVYYASVAQSGPSNFQQLPSSGFSESYSLPNVGVSIKLSPNSDGSDVTQFEFTWDSGNINYDISNINGNPFAAGGMSLVPSQQGASGFPTCVTVDCPAGQSSCAAAYNQPDDVRTMVCPDSSDLVFTLCPGGGSLGTSSQSSSAAPATRSVTSAAAANPSQTAAATATTVATAPRSGRTWAGHHQRGESHEQLHRVHARHLLRR